MLGFRTLLFLCLSCLMFSVSSCQAPAQSGGSAPSSEPIPEGKGRIYFYRKSAFSGKALRPSIVVNGRTVGQSASGTYFFTDLDPGNCQISCSTLMEHTINFELSEGETVYVQTRTTMGIYLGHVRPGIVNSATGAAEVSRLTYTGTK